MQKPTSVKTPSVCVKGHHVGPVPEQCQKCFTPSHLSAPSLYLTGSIFGQVSFCGVHQETGCIKLGINNAALPVVGTSKPAGFDGTIQLCKLK